MGAPLKLTHKPPCYNSLGAGYIYGSDVVNTRGYVHALDIDSAQKEDDEVSQQTTSRRTREVNNRALDVYQPKKTR